MVEEHYPLHLNKFDYVLNFLQFLYGIIFLYLCIQIKYHDLA